MSYRFLITQKPSNLTITHSGLTKTGYVLVKYGIVYNIFTYF